MATVLSKGVIVPDPGETDWAGYLAINWGKLNDVVGAALPDVQNIWTQPQIFQNNAYLTNTSYTVGTIPTSNITTTLFFAGALNYQIGYCRGVVYKTTGQTSAELTARNKFTNGVLDPAGSYINATITVNLDADGTRWIQFANSSIKNGLTPYTTDTYNIGSAANQWLRLFAKFYYYNGVAWGLDQNNTWTGSNTFQTTDVYYSDVEPRYVFKSLGLERGVQPSWHGTATGYWFDKNSDELGFTRFVLYNNSTQTYEIGLQNKATNGDLSPTGSTISTSFQLKLFKTGDSQLTIGANALVPAINNSYDLGTSTNKWKTLNGVNPGALSLPDKSKATSIDTTNFVYGSDFTFTPTVSGWLFVGVTNCTRASLKTGVGEYYFNQSSGIFRDTVPVIAGEQVTLLFVSTATSAPTVTLYPCLGNV